MESEKLPFSVNSVSRPEHVTPWALHRYDTVRTVFFLKENRLCFWSCLFPPLIYLRDARAFPGGCGTASASSAGDTGPAPTQGAPQAAEPERRSH